MIQLQRYIDKVVEHLNVDAIKASKDKLKEMRSLAKSKLEEHTDLLSLGEYNYIATMIARSGTPVPCLLIKDNKDCDKNGKYPTRLVVPTNGFTAAFLHVGMKGLRHILITTKLNIKLSTSNKHHI